MLLEHWTDAEQRDSRFFSCQIEAIETLIWLTEAPDSEMTGIDIPSHGGNFRRICSKLATGTGKTVVMAMLIAWQVINRVTYPRDGRFSKNVFIVAPNLTIRERLSVLNIYKTGTRSTGRLRPRVRRRSRTRSRATIWRGGSRG